MRHAALADRLEPRAHQFVIGARRAEPEQAFRRARLEFRGDRRQAMEQGAISLDSAPLLDRQQQLRQFLLDPPDRLR